MKRTHIDCPYFDRCSRNNCPLVRDRKLENLPDDPDTRCRADIERKKEERRAAQDKLQE